MTKAAIQQRTKSAGLFQSAASEVEIEEHKTLNLLSQNGRDVGASKEEKQDRL